MEVQKLECKSASSEAQESTQGDKLPLLGQNLINRGKREAQTMGINGQLFGMFWLNQYTYSFKHSTKFKNELCINVTWNKAFKFTGWDSHDYLPHGKKHKKKHHKNKDSIKSIKKQHMLSGVEFPSLLSDEGTQWKLFILRT